MPIISTHSLTYTIRWFINRINMRDIVNSGDFIWKFRCLVLNTSTNVTPSQEIKTHFKVRGLELWKWFLHLRNQVEVTGISSIHIIPLGILCTAFWITAFPVYYKDVIHQSDNTFVYIPNILRIMMCGFGASVNGWGQQRRRRTVTGLQCCRTPILVR